MVNILKIKQNEYDSAFEGWGTALKPACEFFTLARKPIGEANIALNCLKWGTGGLNIDACRVGIDKSKETDNRLISGVNNISKGVHCENSIKIAPNGNNYPMYNNNGRYPANFIHDGSNEVQDCFPETEMKDGFKHSASNIFGSKTNENNYNGVCKSTWHNASRVFYCAKASRAERDEGLGFNNFHVTVKPIALMRYLCRLITPQNGIILEPFAGSGTTCIGAMVEGFNFIAFERDVKYYELAKARIEYWKDRLDLLNEEEKENKPVKNQMKLF